MREQKVKIKLLENNYKTQLEKLLKMFSLEVFGSEKTDVDKFINNHWAIYLAIVDEKVIGFSSYNINDYYGLRENVLCNTFMYVDKKYRNTKATYMFLMQTCKICEDNSFDVEYSTDNKIVEKIGNKLNKNILHKTILHKNNDVMYFYNKLKKRIKIK